MRKQERKGLFVRLEPELIERFHRQAALHRTNATNIIGGWIEEWLASVDPGFLPPPYVERMIAEGLIVRATWDDYD